MLICALLIQISKCSGVVNAEPPDYGINFDNLSNLGYDIIHFDDRALMVSFHFFISPPCQNISANYTVQAFKGNHK